MRAGEGLQMVRLQLPGDALRMSLGVVDVELRVLLRGCCSGGWALVHEAGAIALLGKNQVESSNWNTIEFAGLVANETLRKQRDGTVKFGRVSKR